MRERRTRTGELVRCGRGGGLRTFHVCGRVDMSVDIDYWHGVRVRGLSRIQFPIADLSCWRFLVVRSGGVEVRRRGCPAGYRDKPTDNVWRNHLSNCPLPIIVFCFLRQLPFLSSPLLPSMADAPNAVSTAVSEDSLFIPVSGKRPAPNAAPLTPHTAHRFLPFPQRIGRRKEGHCKKHN